MAPALPKHVPSLRNTSCPWLLGACLYPPPTSQSLTSPLRRRRGVVVAAAFGLQGTFLALLSRWDHSGAAGEGPWPAHTAALYAALLYYGGPFVAALVAATLLALLLRTDPLHGAAAALLGAAPLRWAASHSYCLYLLHDFARLWGLLLLPPGLFPRWAAAAPVPALAGLCAFTLVCGYAAAAALQAGVEWRWRWA